MLKKTSLWRGLLITMASILAFSIGAAGIMENYSQVMDENFDSSSYRMQTRETEGEDAWGFKPDYNTTAELIAHSKDLGERMMAEAAVLLKNNGTLPLSGQNVRVTIFGQRSVQSAGGPNNGSLHGGQVGSSAQAKQNVSVTDAFNQRGFTVNPVMAELYNQLDAMSTFQTTNAQGVVSHTYGYRAVSFQNTDFYPPHLFAPLRITEPAPKHMVSSGAANANLFTASYRDYSDAAIVFIGRPASEAADFRAGRVGLATGDIAQYPALLENMQEAGLNQNSSHDDLVTALYGADMINPFSISKNELALIEEAKANFSKVIVIVNAVHPLELKILEDDPRIDAILYVGAVGNYGFLAVADILRGKVNPSGRTQAIYAVDSTSSPAMQNFGIMEFANYSEIDPTTNPAGTGNWDSRYRGNWYVIEAEGIYSGYRYYETRYADIVLGQGNAAGNAGIFASRGNNWNYKDEVLYPFGHGLSYTTFTQTLDSVRVAGNKKSVDVTVTVRNTGNTAGKDVVQIYAQSPYIQGGVEKSAIQLLDFAKTDLIPAGGAQQITFENIDLQWLASYDYKNAKTYILDSGDYYIAIGKNAHDALNNILAELGRTTSNGMTYNGDASKVQKWNWSGAADTTTFSHSKSGARVTNQLDDADFNYWSPNTVTYLSRSNWQATWPKTYAAKVNAYGLESHPNGQGALSAPAAMISQLRNRTYVLKNQDTSDIKFGVNHGLSLSDFKDTTFDDPRWEKLLEQLNLFEGLVSFIYANGKIEPIPSIGMVKIGVQDGPMGLHTNEYDLKPDSPWFVPSTDPARTENGGFDWRVVPTGSTIGCTWSKELAYEHGLLFGNTSIFNNMTLAWAPGQHLWRAPYNGRLHEYYSEDPVLAGQIGANVIKGGLEKGFYFAPKHFAFNNQESNRAGLAQFFHEQRGRELELRAFQMVFEAGARGTMTTFSRIGATFGSAHKGMMTEILKNEWGFKGYAVTDLINGGYYMTPIEALMAGTTHLDTHDGRGALGGWNGGQVPSQYSSSSAAYGSLNGSSNAEGLMWDYFNIEALSRDRDFLLQVKKNYHEFLFAIVNSNAMNGVNSTTTMVWQMTPWRAIYISLIVISSILALAAAALYVTGSLRKKEA